MVLCHGEGKMITALHLNSYAEVIASALPRQFAGSSMPGTTIEGNILNHLAASSYKEVGRQPQPPNVRQHRVVHLDTAKKQLVNVVTAKLTRQQADVVDHQGADGKALGAGILKGAESVGCTAQPAPLRIQSVVVALVHGENR